MSRRRGCLSGLERCPVTRLRRRRPSRAGAGLTFSSFPRFFFPPFFFYPSPRCLPRTVLWDGPTPRLLTRFLTRLLTTPDLRAQAQRVHGQRQHRRLRRPWTTGSILLCVLTPTRRALERRTERLVRSARRVAGHGSRGGTVTQTRLVFGEKMWRRSSRPLPFK